MITLGIETSCDETSIGVVNNGRMLSNIVASSLEFHKVYGGVVPEIASRHHIECINYVFKKAVSRGRIRLKDIDLIAFTESPGLVGSLLAGISFAKALAWALGKPLVSVNHLHAHLLANFLEKRKKKLTFPFIGLVISGGHTSILLCEGCEKFKSLGNTTDDAVGEAFDKVAKILKLPYPGGPVIEKRARRFNGKGVINFPKASLQKNSFDFSFSGIKTAVLYYVRNRHITKKEINRIAYSFQENVFGIIVKKTIDACLKSGLKEIAVGGGVASNRRFCEILRNNAKHYNLDIFIPRREYCLDNGAMVAAIGEQMGKRGVFAKSVIPVKTGI